MSESEGTFPDRLNGYDGDITGPEAEAYAAGVADMLHVLGIGVCSKGYDPLRIDSEEKIARTYAFDLWDGGRHHPYASIRQVVAGIRLEAFTRLAQSEFPVNPDLLNWARDFAVRHGAVVEVVE